MLLKDTELLKSPMNYTGGKFKLLPQLLPLFPQDIDCFVDLFTGGLDVALNIKAVSKLCNDKESHVIDFYSQIQGLSGDEVDECIMRLVKEYELSKENKAGYLTLRSHYNASPSWDKFYGLLAHSFSHQIRFNRKGDFNVPFGVGRSFYNSMLKSRLKLFTDRIDTTYSFTNQDFKEVDLSHLDENSFVYCDPPYLITTASYNEGNGWLEKDEKTLLSLLDDLDERGIKFGLSNVLSQGDKVNTVLLEWSTKYKVHNLDFGYGNSSYHKKAENKVNTREVFICNY